MREEKVIVSHSIEKEHSLANHVQIACRFDSRIQVRCGEKTLNAKSILGVMSLNPQAGTELTVTAEGADESQAIREIIDYLR
mgnify:FL=1